MVLSKKVRLKIPNSTYTFYLNLFTSLIAFFALCISISFYELNTDWIGFEWNQWLVLLTLALLPSLLGHTLIIYILPKFNINFVSIFKLGSPILAATMAFFIFNEELSVSFFFGLFFVAAGVFTSIGVNKN